MELRIQDLQNQQQELNSNSRLGWQEKLEKELYLENEITTLDTYKRQLEKKINVTKPANHKSAVERGPSQLREKLSKLIIPLKQENKESPNSSHSSSSIPSKRNRFTGRGRFG